MVETTTNRRTNFVPATVGRRRCPKVVWVYFTKFEELSLNNIHFWKFGEIFDWVLQNQSVFFVNYKNSSQLTNKLSYYDCLAHLATPESES